MKVNALGGDYKKLPPDERMELSHCLLSNLEFVRKLDTLKSLAFFAYEQGDMGWHHEICEQLEALEANLV